jgi:hypothetical protein
MVVNRPEGRTQPDTGRPAPAAEPDGDSRPLIGRVRDRVSQELNARKDRASELLTELAGSVRRVGEPEPDEAPVPLSEYAIRAADQLERFAEDLRERDVAELADEVRGLARRRPAAFAAAGFAAGLLAARFMKSTAAGAPPTGVQGAKAAEGRRAHGRARFGQPDE